MTIETEETEESERDLESTERSEVQTESEKTLHEEMSLSTGVNISASYGPVVSVDTAINASLGTSSDTSTSVASTMAQDIVDRSVTKVTKSVRETIVERRLSETEEISTHDFVNNGPDHVHGVYRWLEQVWEAQVMNYGRRLMLELVVPEPSALYRAACEEVSSEILAPKPSPLGSLKHTDLDETNYDDKVQLYGATGVTPPPTEIISVEKTFELPELEHQKKLANNDFVVQTKSGVIDVPAGYVAVHAWADESKAKWDTGEEQLRAHVGNRILDLIDSPRDGGISNVSGPMEATIFMYDFKAATVDIRVKCERTPELFEEWQLATYAAIVEAHDRMEAAYQAEVKQAETTEAQGRDDVHPEVKRAIEAEEIKRVALNMLTDQDFSSFDAVSGPSTPQPQPAVDVAEALREGRRVLFHEQAFEWPQMTYVFYPYFWGRQDNWYEVMNQTDSDPTFEAFLKAGSARVQVPVRPGFERTVLYYLMTNRIWNGGSVPVIGDNLYVPISQEISESKDLSITDPVPYGEAWTYAIPTSLVWVDDNAPDVGLP